MLRVAFCSLFFLILGSSFGQKLTFTKVNPQEGKKCDFSFVHITDTHIGEGDEDGDYGTYGWLDEAQEGDEGYAAKRLRKAVAWINANKDSLNIRFVIVTGDLTDSGERSEFLKCKEIMSALTVPYIPFIGNHDVWPYTRHDEAATPCGDSLINTLFREEWETARSFFSGLDSGTKFTRIWNPEAGNANFLQNFSFRYGAYRFVFSDFGTRKHAEPGELGVGPQADLHHFTGGTFSWLNVQLANSSAYGKRTFLFSHFPMTKDPLVNIHLSSMSFGFSEYAELARMLYPYRDRLFAWFCGHIHRDKVQDITRPNESEPILQCIETAANKKYEEGHFRVVMVWE